MLASALTGFNGKEHLMPKISACIVAYCDYDEVCAAVRSILPVSYTHLTLPTTPYV